MQLRAGVGRKLRAGLVGAGLAVGILAAAPPAGATPVASDPTMLVLPLTGTPDVQLTEHSIRMLVDVDYTATLSLFTAVDPPVHLSDLEDAFDEPVLFNVGFTFRWFGTVNGIAAEAFYGAGNVPPIFYFTLIDERWRLPGFSEANPLGTSVSVIGGYVATSFTGDVVEAPLNVADAPGGGLISDVVGNQWIGVKMPLVAPVMGVPVPVSFQFVWALGSDVTGLDGFDNDLNIRFFREAFVAPEPGALFLLATGLLGLAARARLRA